MKTEAVKENGNEFFVTQYIPIVKFFLKKKKNLEVFPSFLEEVIGNALYDVHSKTRRI